LALIKKISSLITELDEKSEKSELAALREENERLRQDIRQPGLNPYVVASAPPK